MNHKIKHILKISIIFILWLLLILAFPHKDKPMDEICWVIDTNTAMVVAMNKTYDEALAVVDMYPNNKLIILKQID